MNKMSKTDIRRRPIMMALATVIALFAARVLIGDELSGFIDGLVAGFTDGV